MTAFGLSIFVAYLLLFCFLTVKNSAYALLAIFCLFGLEQWGAIYSPFIAQNPEVLNFSVFALAVYAWFKVPTGTSYTLLKNPVWIFWVLMIIWIMITSLWAPRDVQSLELFIYRLPYLFIAIYLAPTVIQRTEQLTKVLDAFTILGGLLVILFAFIPDWEGRGIVSQVDDSEEVSLPLALSLFSGYVILVTFIRITARPVRIIWAVIVFVSGFVLISKTGSRGQFIFTLVALIFCLPAKWKYFSVNKAMVYGITLLIAALSYSLVVFTENSVSSRMSFAERSTDARLDKIALVLEAWSSDTVSLIFGLGSSASYSNPLGGGYPHNVPLEILGELGIVGFLIFLAIVVTVLRYAFVKQYKFTRNDRTNTDFTAIFSCWFLAFLVSLKQGSLISSPDLFMFSILAVQYANISSLSNSRRKIRRQRTHNRLYKVQSENLG